MKPIDIPIVAEEDIPYLPMPSGMNVYAAPQLPEPEEMAEHSGAKQVLSTIRDALSTGSGRIEIEHLEAGDRQLLAQILGEGEVSVRVDPDARMQESLLTGVWLASSDCEWIEVGAFPEGVTASARESALDVRMPENMPEGVMNSPSVLAELLTKSASGKCGVINLTLLPMTQADLVFLDSMLGRGGVTILSRGYGNCRVTSTHLRDVWRVQYYNSQDVLILDTLEIVDLPEVVRAAPEDIEDSLERLTEIMQWVGV